MFVNLTVLDHPSARWTLAFSVFRLNLLVCLVLLSNLVLTGCRDKPSSQSLDRFSSDNAPEIVLADGTTPVKAASDKTEDFREADDKLLDPIPKPPSVSLQLPTPPVIHFLNDHEEYNLPVLTEGQLHKNFTLILLAAQPDLRAQKILKPINKSLTEKQRAEAIKLILANDYKYLKLQRRRSEILANARSGDDIESELKRIDSEIVATSMNLQSSILESVRKRKTK
jgi:hypothetical protein